MPLRVDFKNAIGNRLKIVTGKIFNQGDPDEVRAIDVVQRDSDGNIIRGEGSRTVIDSIDQSDLTANVYTVSDDPATQIDGLINDSAGDITVTVADASRTIVKTLKPDDVWSADFEGFTTITFSAGALFRADILR